MSSRFTARYPRLFLTVVVVLAITACQKKKEPAEEAPAAAAAPAADALEGQVDIVAWPGYVERGDTDKNYDWVTSFEQETTCKVNVKTAGTSDEMVSLMTQGGYDLVTASGDASLRLIRGGTVQPVDISRIPSYANVDDRLKEAPWHYVDGKHYGTPYQWGPNVLMYNTTVFKTPPKSWSVVFEPQKLPDAKPNKGRIQAYDGPIHVADAALYLMTKRPELGIKNPYELNEDQYTAALEVLRKQHPLVHRYWHDANVQVQDFTNEGVVASSSWPFQVNTLIANKQPIASTVPAEGATGWADTTMLATDAKHPNCAYRWMEWSLNAKVQGDLASWFGSVPAVPAACEGNPLLGPEGCKTNGFENFERIWFWRTPEATCSQGTCVPYSRWATDYVAVMGGR
jgi:putative spermidine/putrescine transport system substrate-binding protein